MGVNAIPEVFADELSLRLGWEVDGGVVQVNVVSHTGADGFSRLARQAEFDGTIQPGAEYVMVDDLTILWVWAVHLPTCAVTLKRMEAEY
jgi:hypothetical protein